MSNYINSSSPLLLVGTGAMGLEYAKVLKALNINFKTVGRSLESSNDFSNRTELPVVHGGVDYYLESHTDVPNQAIVTVGMEQLAPVTSALLNKGVKRILVEKPAGLNLTEIQNLNQLAKERNSEVFVAYNRRFYSSVIEAQKIILQDGGVSSFHFEFTEWAHVISKLNKPIEILNQLFLANSTHIVDMAFFLGGSPKQVSCYTAGHLDWHPRASAYAGAGITEMGALFSYHANWTSPGRWSLDILTARHRLIFRPLEKLMVQQIGELEGHLIDIDDELDIKFKPGLFRQVEAFIYHKENDRLLYLSQHCEMITNIYEKMLNA